MRDRLSAKIAIGESTTTLSEPNLFPYPPPSLYLLPLP